ncbi:MULTISPECIES: hypothetical protein [Actinosynnema]|uniref:hypothetical protein n=1 Tax=Actinosynnema TaxID=40566 RepID=UPI0020A5AFA8|nr:hypothetical protein [Actinosynnema pretiosum]MCP2095028.1 hypothetical protein [Actinosynnema pretiosum]
MSGSGSGRRDGAARNVALIAAVGASVGVLSLLVAFSDRVRGDGGEASASALSGSATNRPGAVTGGGAPACGDPTPADGLVVAFRAPCGGVVDGPLPVVELDVPAYPEGRLVLLARELTTPDGVPHERPPVRVLTWVDAGTADPGRAGPGVWARPVPVGGDGCARSGRVELLVHLLTGQGALEASGWRAGQEVTVPQGARRLDSVALTRSDPGC